jgi:hypothetical protein
MAQDMSADVFSGTDITRRFAEFIFVHWRAETGMFANFSILNGAVRTNGMPRTPTCVRDTACV